MAKQAIKIGARAPACTLLDQDDKKVSLKGLSGKWVVLYFYPKDDTSGCTKEACEFTNNLKEFEKLGACVLGVSPDPPQRHRKFIAKYELKIDLLSDPDHKVMARYGAWGEKSMYGRTYEGVIRSTFLIDPDGKIAFCWPKVRAAGHADKVRAKLAELIAE